MNLFTITKQLQTIEEKIKQRRLQMLIHSYIYYELNTNIITDFKWSQWAMELVQLQKDNPIASKNVIYYNEFKNWDGNTGAFLQYDKWVKDKAIYLLKITHNK